MSAAAVGVHEQVPDRGASFELRAALHSLGKVKQVSAAMTAKGRIAAATYRITGLRWRYYL